jgi:hypothetical protein
LRARRELFADIFRIGALASLPPLFTVLTIGVVNRLVGAFGVSARPSLVTRTTPRRWLLPGRVTLASGFRST